MTTKIAYTAVQPKAKRDGGGLSGEDLTDRRKVSIRPKVHYLEVIWLLVSPETRVHRSALIDFERAQTFHESR